MKNFGIRAQEGQPVRTDIRSESPCETLFSRFSPFWHIYTPENQPIFFPDDNAFRTAMNVTAVCVKSCLEVRLITFEWMSNHFHGVCDGRKEDVESFARLLIRMVGRALKKEGYCVTLSGAVPNIRQICSLKDLRNVVSYVNRNGFLVSPGETPFSYPWGANRYYFNPDAKELFWRFSTPVRVQQLRDLSHSRLSDGVTGLLMLDGYVCPLCYCEICFWEGLFQNAQQYFYHISRQIESHKSIAREIGEQIFYTDDELFASISSLCAKEFGNPRPSLVPVEAKMLLAKKMRFEYNASVKQISRILRLDTGVVKAMFPPSLL